MRTQNESMSTPMQPGDAHGNVSIPGQETLPEPCTENNLSLLDLPVAWLAKLLKQHGSQDQPMEPEQFSLDLFRCCRALRDLVLVHHTLHLEFKVPMQPDAEEPALAKLLLACERSSHVAISFSFNEDEQGATPFQMSASASKLLCRAAAAKDQGLAAVRKVKLEGCVVDALVPTWLASTCPNLTSLTLDNTCFRHPQTATTPCSHLQQLKLKNMHNCACIDAEQLISALPALTSLTLSCVCSSFLNVFAPMGAQLTHLKFSPVEKHYSPPQHPCKRDLQRLFATSYPNLTVMRLPETFIDDGLLQCMLDMQHLTALDCQGFRLQHSHTHHPCRWTHLGFSELDVPSFDRLNLGGVQSLQVLGTILIIRPPMDDGGELRVISRVGAAVAGLTWKQQHWGSRVYVDNEGAGAGSASLAALMPLVSLLKTSSVVMDSVRGVTAELLAAIQQHLCEAVLAMSFINCSLAPGVGPLLLPFAAPASGMVNYVEFIPGDSEGLSEAELMQVCVHACRPVHVHVCPGSESGWQDGWEERVSDAMAAAGHQHVKLVEKLSPWQWFELGDTGM